jgi:hypothetical protein
MLFRVEHWSNNREIKSILPLHTDKHKHKVFSAESLKMCVFLNYLISLLGRTSRCDRQSEGGRVGRGDDPKKRKTGWLSQ